MGVKTPKKKSFGGGEAKAKIILDGDDFRATHAPFLVPSFFFFFPLYVVPSSPHSTPNPHFPILRPFANPGTWYYPFNPFQSALLPQISASPPTQGARLFKKV